MSVIALVILALLIAPLDAQQRRYVESPAAPPYREGMKLLTNEHWDEAAELFERAISLDNEYPLAFYGLGRARIGQKHFVAAVSALERCAALYVEQANASASRKMELSQRRQDQILELRDQLRDLSVGPQNARRQLQAQQVQDQIQDLEHSMRDDIGDLTLRVPAFVSLSLGSAYFRKGSMAEAEREYRNAIKAKPAMGEAHNNLAVVLLLTGRPEEAERSLKQAERSGFKVSPELKADIRQAVRK
jgi:tetratricopeptide (TPR) repeat protein